MVGRTGGVMKMNRVMGRRWWAGLIVLMIWWVAIPAAALGQESGEDGWWSTHYLVDYSLIAAGTGVFVLGESLTPRTPALIGPAYDPESPMEITDHPALDQPYLAEGTEETVPASWVIGGIGVGLAGLAAMEGAHWYGGSGSAPRFHDTVVGFSEAVALTAGLTSLTKPVVGRLRPDFGERARRYHCNQEQYPGCGTETAPLADDPEHAQELLHNGQRSFFSGHSSHSFNLATYGILAIGGRYVWGEQATGGSQIGGLVAQSLLLGLAMYTSGSRLIDGRHHRMDVVTGALVGMAVANFSYWRRFDSSGGLRRLSASPQMAIGATTASSSPTLTITIRH